MAYFRVANSNDNSLGFIIGGYHLGKVSTLAHFMATDAGWVV